MSEIILYWTEVTYWASYQHMTEHDAQPKTNVKKPEKEEGHTLLLIFKKNKQNCIDQDQDSMTGLLGLQEYYVGVMGNM